MNADSGTRTRTEVALQRILSPLRLPVPPCRRGNDATMNKAHAGALARENDGQCRHALRAMFSAITFTVHPMKTLFFLVLSFALILASAGADEKADATATVNSFYASYVGAIKKKANDEKVAQKSPQLSPGFKKAYAALMAKAWKTDPELGLGYDPIICGQDFPDAGYAV